MALNNHGLNGGIKQLRIGKSFTQGYNADKYHTIRYDFKPASVDTKKDGTMEVDNKEVTLSVPHIEGVGASHAIFKGTKTPTTRDCLLIIDQTTGEIVLEKISHNIRVKKTRIEKNSRRLVNNVPFETSARKPSPSQNLVNAATARSSQKPPVKNASSSSLKTSSSHMAPGSMPMLLDDSKNDSDDSSSDSESGSSSSSDSDSDSEPEETPKYNNYTPSIGSQNGISASTPKSPPSSIFNDLELSEED